MRKIVTVFSMIFMMGFVTACGWVNPGEVGIMVNKYGDDTERGVPKEVLPVGWYLTFPTKTLYTFPTFTVTKQYDEFDIQADQGVSAKARIGVTFSVEQDKVPLLFQKYRKGVDEISEIQLRQLLYSAMNTSASRMSIEDIIGPKKADLLKATEERLRSQVGPYGINIESVNILSEIVPPDVVKDSINEKIIAQQKSITRNNEIETTKAEAEKNRIEAKGLADAAVEKAEAEAKAITIRGEAIRKNPELITLEAIQRWNGQMPATLGYVGNADQLVNMLKKQVD
ncbi:HflK-like protein [Ochrobactrum phage vB_OspM_OC]|nr:HflK-like protein [Ochrobactrum phage vB_OspM_OC]